MTTTGSARPHRFLGWLTKNARYLIAIALGMVGLFWLLQVPRICGQELGGVSKDAPIEVCRAVQLTDPVVLAWVLGIVLVLWGTLSEASIAGVVTLKRVVAEAKQATEEARATLLRINASAHQSQQQVVSVTPSAPGQFSVNAGRAGTVDLPRPEVVESIQPNRADASVSRETVDLTYVDLVDWVVRGQLQNLVDSVPGASRAHTYVQDINGLLSRIDGPVGDRGRSWRPGEGAVGMAWMTGAFVSDEPTTGNFTAVAATPILNSAGRSIGVLSLHSSDVPPPDLGADDVLFEMSATSERMARVYVDLLRIETDT